MRIALFYPSHIPYSWQLLAEAPLGGAETAVLHMARALSELDHSVEIVRRAEDLASLGDIDVLVLKRHPILLEDVPTGQVYFWTPDDTDQPSFEPLRNDHYRAAFLGQVRWVFALSSYQSFQFQALGIPQDRITQTRNGVDLALFSGSDRSDRAMRCLYTSTPFRGLHVLLSLWPLIHREVPSAELHIYSSMAVYHRSERPEYEALYELAERTPGVTHVGSVAQPRLAAALCEARLWLYPNTFPETSCIAAMEAQAAGCVLVTSSAGALPETAAGNLFVHGDPLSRDYLATFASLAIRLLHHPEQWEYLSQRNRTRAQLFDWRDVAREWSLLFEEEARTTP